VAAFAGARVALVFAGPLRWSLWRLPPCSWPVISGPRTLTTNPWLTSPRAAPVLAAVLAAVVFIGARTLIADRLPTGDEPHYLLLTQSMVHDRDLDVENNYTQRDYAPYYSGDLEPHWYVRGVGNRGILYHLPGVSALIAPALCSGIGGSGGLAGASGRGGHGAGLAVRPCAHRRRRFSVVRLGDGIADPAARGAGGDGLPDAPGAILVAAVLLALARDERARRTRRPGTKAPRAGHG